MLRPPKLSCANLSRSLRQRSRAIAPDGSLGFQFSAGVAANSGSRCHVHYHVGAFGGPRQRICVKQVRAPALFFRAADGPRWRCGAIAPPITRGPFLNCPLEFCQTPGLRLQ